MRFYVLPVNGREVVIENEVDSEPSKNGIGPLTAFFIPTLAETPSAWAPYPVWPRRRDVEPRHQEDASMGFHLATSFLIRQTGFRCAQHR
jgi:hypothetical protein